VADWYVSSAAYAAIAAFVPSVAYSVGQIVKPTAPALKAQWVFRCTVAGTASTEPAWPTANNGTVVSGGATFANVTAQGTYGWSAAAGDLPTLLGAVGTFRFAGGDRMFVSSDHAESQTTTSIYGSGGGTAGYGVALVLSVNRAGSVPPVAGDLTPGASVTVGGAISTLNLDTTFPVYHYGMNYITTGAGVTQFIFQSTGSKASFFDACQLYLNTATAGARLQAGSATNIILNNSTVRFGAVSQGFGGTNPLEILWLNTPAAIPGATIPAMLFGITLGSTISVTARGVDFSAVTGVLVGNSNPGSTKCLFDSCRIAAAATRYSWTGQAAVTTTRDIVELINCYDGTSILNESYQPAGSVTTERSITLSGGATDDVGTYSHKLVSNTNVDKYVNPLTGFWLDVEQQAVGSSKTATVEIISSASLNSDEISLLLEYQGTAGSSVASFANTLPATVLSAATAVTTSTATWNSSPATPVKQLLSVSFVPQLAGRVRGQVRLGKPSTTVYVNPVITIA
jgi:hypothetical protein